LLQLAITRFDPEIGILSAIGDIAPTMRRAQDTFKGTLRIPERPPGLLNTPIGMHFNGLDAFLLDFRY
jgi:hypothetical protein